MLVLGIPKYCPVLGVGTGVGFIVTSSVTMLTMLPCVMPCQAQNNLRRKIMRGPLGTAPVRRYSERRYARAMLVPVPHGAVLVHAIVVHATMTHALPAYPHQVSHGRPGATGQARCQVPGAVRPRQYTPRVAAIPAISPSGQRKGYGFPAAATRAIIA